MGKKRRSALCRVIQIIHLNINLLPKLLTILHRYGMSGQFYKDSNGNGFVFAFSGAGDFFPTVVIYSVKDGTWYLT